MTQGDDETRVVDRTRTMFGPNSEELAGLAIGQRFGNFRLVRELGRGGMGAVFLAEQTAPVCRMVAIKLINRRQVGLEEQILFELERQALARLNHPAIAQIFDAGQTGEGLPFYVMEHVEGEPIHRFVRRRQPDARTCIDLVRQIAEGLDHAHRRGLVHCDIKPSNLLVAALDGRLRAKLIDFGIARGGGSASVGAAAGTPAYMSPEQATPGAAVDARSDIYSLGIVLFELVTGESFRPEGESRGFSTEADARPAPARSLLGCPNALGLPRARLRELDAILGKAMAEHPQDRYPTAAALATDLEAWLARRPVSALAGSRRYRLACLWRRNPAAVSAAAIGAAAVLAGLVGTSAGLVEARRQQAMAESRRADLEKVVAFQQQVLSRVDLPALTERMVGRLADNAARVAEREGSDGAAAGARIRAELEGLAPLDATRAVIVEGLLHEAADLVDQEYATGDGIEAALRLSIAQLFVPWQDFDRAERALARAVELYRAIRGPEALETLTAETEVMKLTWWRQSFDEAYRQANALVPRATAALGSRHPLTLYLRRAQAATLSLTGDGAGALALSEALLPQMRDALGADHPDTLQIEGDILNQRTVAMPERCPDGLIREFEGHLERLRARGPAVGRTLAVSAGNYAICLAANGDVPGAARAWGDAVEIRRKVFGEHHLITLLALSDHGYYLLESGDLEGAERIALGMLEQQAALLGGLSHPTLLHARNQLLLIRSLRGEHAAALAGFRALRDEIADRGDLPHQNRRWVLAAAAFAAVEASEGSLALAWVDDALAHCERADDQHPTCRSLEVSRLAARELVGDIVTAEELADLYRRLAGRLHPKNDAVLHLAVWLCRLSDDRALRAELDRSQLDWLRAAPEQALSSSARRLRHDLLAWERDRAQL
jgi:hypothetical protein